MPSKDQLPQVDTRPFRPVYDEADMSAANAIKTVGQGVLDLTKGAVVSGAIKDTKATLEAYTAMQGDASASPNDPSALFAGTSDRAREAGLSMINQLKQETGSLEAAMSQGRLSSSVAMARLENIVKSRAAAFPGFEREIDNAVSGFLGFSTAGFAAKRILGLDQPKAEEKKLTELEKFKWAESNRFRKELNDLYGPDAVDQLAGPLTDDPDTNIRNMAPLTKALTTLNSAKHSAAQNTANGVNDTVAFLPVVEANMATAAADINSVAQRGLEVLKNSSFNEIRQDYVATLNTTKANLIAKKAGLDALLTKGIPTEHRVNLDRGVLNEKRSQLATQIDEVLKLVDIATQADSKDSAIIYAGLLQRADIFERAPSLTALHAVVGNMAFGSVLGSWSATNLADSAARELQFATGLEGGALSVDSKVDMLDTLQTYLSAYDTDRGKPNEMYTNDATKEKTSLQVGAGVSAILDSIKRGTMSAKDASTILPRLMAVWEATNGKDTTGLPYRSPDQIMTLVNALADPAVIKNMTEEDKVRAREFRMKNLVEVSDALFTTMPQKYLRGTSGLPFKIQGHNLADVVMLNNRPNPAIFDYDPKNPTRLRVKVRLRNVEQGGEAADAALARWVDAYNLIAPKLNWGVNSLGDK